MHEITHTLGPREALGEYYSPIEEGKDDIGGL